MFLRAAATATGTTVAFTSESKTNELVQNKALGKLINSFTPVSYEREHGGVRWRACGCRPEAVRRH